MYMIEFLVWAREVTDIHMKTMGAWSPKDQIVKIIEELGELITSLKREGGWIEDDHLTHKDEVIEEIWDLIFTILVLAHTLNISDNDLYDGLTRNINKISERVKAIAER